MAFVVAMFGARKFGMVDVIAETDDLLVANKPAGLLVHPTKPGGPVTLLDQVRELLAYEMVNGGQVSIINRLDRETSGVVLMAKSSESARATAMAMQAGQIRKAYLAAVFGWPPEDAFSADGAILRLGEVASSMIWLKRAVHPDGAAAATQFEVVSRHRRQSDGAQFSIMRCYPLTGRMHQIRVHLASLGFPVIGDKLYGPDEMWYLRFIEQGWTDAMQAALWLNRHALHSASLQIADGPVWAAPLPQDIMSLLRQSTLVTAADPDVRQ